MHAVTREVVEKLVGWLDSAGNFAVDQAPLLVREIVAYGYLVCGAWLFVGLIMLGFGLLGARYCQKRTNRPPGYVEFTDGTIVGCIAAGAGAFITITSLVILFKIYFAPRLYILTELGGIV